MGKNQSAAVCTYDFTIPRKDATYDEVIDRLLEIAKKWAFQIEKGEETGYEHFQGRMSLKVRTRLAGAKQVLKYPTAHLSITSNENRDNAFYVMKEDTRLDGPWTDETYVKIPRQIQGITLRHWQQEIVDSANNFNSRIVNVLVDEKGKVGKSTVKTYVGVNRIGRALPFVNDYKDVMRMVCNMPVARLYIIDLPRAIKKDHLSQLYAAIETIKDGYCYDDRYHFKERYFDSPAVWVFTNKRPDRKLMSKDRWKVWQVDEDETLCRYEG